MEVVNKASSDYVVLIDREENKQYPFENLKGVAKHLKTTVKDLATATETHWISPRYQLLFPNKPRSPFPLGKIKGRKKWADILDLWKEKIKENPSTKFSVNAIYREAQLSIQRGYYEFEYQNNRYCILDKDSKPVPPKVLPEITPGDDIGTIITKVEAKAREFKLSPYAVALYSMSRGLFKMPDSLLNQLHLNP